MQKNKLYNTKLGAGLGLVNETRVLLELWHSGISANKLYQEALRSGMFPNIAARRLLNIVSDCFAPRYLIDNGQPATNIKNLMPNLTSTEFQQLLLLYTCRDQKILADFIKNVYWEKYSAGYSEITNEDSRKFVETAVDRGLTVTTWAESMITRVTSYLTGCCADYGLLESGRKSKRKILPFRISPKVFVYLTYELHFLGLGDNFIVENEDWKLFGLNQDDVLEELKRISTKGYFIMQSAGNAVRIGWNYKDFEEVNNVIAEI